MHTHVIERDPCPQNGPLVQRVQGPFARLCPLQLQSADGSLRWVHVPEQRRKIKVRISGRVLYELPLTVLFHSATA